ncbi:O-linked N-acetylglucosamine transferase, SPINDLY family protein [Methylophilus aquaticus]|uniref:protein O-GlcNAc transferase n=1 Tax=Methylophilus aquaticus TaxID=1971610 RepID=A0ABT9JT98_9PROT|nr:tetratricopeptide repeat protein [Methylophilus aquaticus]MDP8567798.1 tetratricopeptide repeat protein [Methylophilus aquaticus]
MSATGIQHLQQRIAHHPDNPELHYELGRAYLLQKQAAPAAQAFAQALRLAPNHPQILMQLGNVASLEGNEVLASDYFRQSLAVDAQQADVQFNLANSLRKQGQLAAAIVHYRHALQLQPNDADMHNNLGNAWRESGELALAVAAYATALEHAPHMVHARVHWIHQKQHMADWSGLDAAIQEVRAALQHPQAQIPPFAFLAMPGTTDAEQTRCASLWAQAHYGHVQALPRQIRQANRRIKLAYLSSDFRRHPLAYLITDVIQAHDRTQFEIYAYSQALDDGSLERQQLQSAVEHWQDIAQLPDDAVAQHMRMQGIDIVVDLTGYTQNSRCGIVAYRPASLHVNWLGYPGSMGLLNGKPLYDLIVVDDTLQMPHLAEEAIVLPCYQPNNAQRPLADRGTRRDHKLPDDCFVFCSFNQSFKITPDVFASWMCIMQQVPHSVLWLLESNRWAVENLKKAAHQAGIQPQRLVFAPRADIATHIARQQHADLMLDTLPYNAHTTASDALSQGVPILTIAGETFASRVTTSLLKYIQLHELICHDWQAYENTAIQLALHPEELRALKQKVTAQSGRLFAPERYVKSLEDALITALNKQTAIN